MCQADPIEEFRKLQSKIKSEINSRQKGLLLVEMGNKAQEWLNDVRDPVRSALDAILEDISNQSSRETIILNTIFILTYPDDCLGITKRVEEIEDIQGARRHVGNLLNKIKEHLQLDDSPNSPIVKLCKRYN
ncbi:MAG: hypothetical protein LBB05_01400 [Puniceicoccales bacterium]|jgi:hypothetical protein|nr:hypothetical protein [Puniceicoccales bacterium]